MNFYDINLLSLIFIGLIYFVGTSFLIRLAKKFAGKSKRAWLLAMPLFLLLYSAPVAEEFWVAWNFGQLCRKDAGIFVNKTVKVDGFYDASALLPIHYANFISESVNYYKMAGYRYIEFGLAQGAGQPKKIVHIEKINGEWQSSVLDKPMARYYYWQPHRGTYMSHKVTKVERVVIDNETGEILARETRYRRSPPWFYVGNDRRAEQCPGPSDKLSPAFGSVYKLTLIPAPTGT